MLILSVIAHSFTLRKSISALLPFSADITNSWFVFYAGFFPLITCVHATIDLALFFFAQLNPICTLMVSILFFVGWILQISFWCHCDYAPDSDTCYQFYVMGNEHSDMIGSLNGVSDRITAAKVIFGVMMLVLYVLMPLWSALILSTLVCSTKRSGAFLHVGTDCD